MIAQDKIDAKKVLMSDQTDQWMTKISSDSEMRGRMMAMMIDETKVNKEEMTRLVNSMMDNPGMHDIMLAMQPVNTENRNITLEPRGMMNDSLKVMKMYNTSTVPKK